MKKYLSAEFAQQGKAILFGLILSACLISGPASADLLALTFDGNASPGTIYQKDNCKAVEGGLAAYPCVKYVPGKQGQAIQLNQYSVVAAPVHLDPHQTPQITFTAWIKRPQRGGRSGYLLSSGGSGGLPHFSLYGGALSINGGRSSIRYPDELPELPRDEWVFVAGVWDYEAQTMRVHQNDAHQSYSGLKMDLNPSKNYVVAESPTWLVPDAPAGAEGHYVFIGAANTVSMGTTATKVAIDDVRLFSRALSVAEVDAIRQGKTGTPYAVSTTPTSDPIKAIEESSTGVPDPAGTGDAATASSTPGGGLLSGQQAPASGTDNLEDKAPIDLEYESDEAALAAQRERDAAAAVSDASTETRTQALEEEESTASGYTLSPETTLTGISGIGGQNIYPIDLVDSGIDYMRIYSRGIYDGIPTCIRIYAASGDRNLTAPMTGFKCKHHHLGVVMRGASITALATCDSGDDNDNKRVKGIEVRGYEIGKDGEFGMYRKKTDKNVNCNYWNTLQICNDNSIATGIVAHFSAPSGLEMHEKLVGVQLICRMVIPNK